jgi:hypothetical protein
MPKGEEEEESSSFSLENYFTSLKSLRLVKTLRMHNKIKKTLLARRKELGDL